MAGISAPPWEVNTVAVDVVERVRSGVADADGEPVGDAAPATGDALAGDSCFDSAPVHPDLDEPLDEEIGSFTPADVVFVESPQIADVHLAGVVDADPRAVIKLVDLCWHLSVPMPRRVG